MSTNFGSDERPTRFATACFLFRPFSKFFKSSVSSFIEPK